MRGDFDFELSGLRSGVVVIVVLTLGCLMTCANGVLHKVGGVHGWNQNVNYTEWSANVRFHVDDWLIFNFDKRYYNVLEVNKTSYEYCNDKGFIKNITRGGRDVYQLTEARPYYFITGGGYCYHGMKLALVTVQDELPASAPPALAPSTNNASPNYSFTSSTQILVFLSIVVSFRLVWDIDIFKA